MSLLFKPFSIRNLTLKNRLVMAPMCMYEANDDGFVKPFHVVHYASRAMGGIGSIILEATAVCPQGRITASDLGIWSDAHIPGLKEITEQIKAYGTVPGIQLAHAGRKATVDGETFAPSAIAYNESYKVPTEMSLEQIKVVIEQFKVAAERAIKAGFEVLEIHGAHGYLINEFLSPLSNKRTDSYGGSTENRYRLLREIIDAIRSIWDGVLFVRISADDYAEGGLNAQDYVQISEWMKEQDVDLIDVSTGSVVPATIDTFPLYQVPHAVKVREAGLPVGAVGLITTGKEAESILQNKQADVIIIGRELLRDPYFAYHAAKELDVKLTPAVKTYQRAW
ncbi:NADPH dehydrogenase NamA [Lysinibacillus sp. 2017]|uniref:NADPH dehydrogenase NamA n=1 Tax=unclassified Lysinibacillus TaxID=2636778 RepID=UPI000D528886|nr:MULTISPECIES: NADPH dehydrogenase NamA [unclassified Lysinibacillus]AWE07850.1 NADPH dehydrogenase NamA [Lysinibacillus sp. 2017]TGN32257.1 NADPH dehydrogenase NamA [Lysinibacillus sp. S2017]